MKTQLANCEGSGHTRAYAPGFLRSPGHLFCRKTEFIDWSSTCQDAAGVCDGTNVSAQLGMLRSWLSMRWLDPVLREAICLASPSLFRSLEVWKKNQTVNKDARPSYLWFATLRA